MTQPANAGAELKGGLCPLRLALLAFAFAFTFGHDTSPAVSKGRGALCAVFAGRGS